MVFDRVLRAVAALSMPTVAGVGGLCLGGGFELALACTARVAQTSPKTTFGLPETGVGLFPAGGGTQRLSRLIGAPAIEMILSGRPVSAQKAAELGIVDELVPADANLRVASVDFARKLADGEVKLRRPALDAATLETAAEEALEKDRQHRGGRFLPGPEYAVRVIVEGAKLPLDEALKLEKQYFIDKVVTSN